MSASHLQRSFEANGRNEISMTANSLHRAGRIGRSPSLPGIGLWDIVIEFIFATRLDLHLVLRADIILFRNQVEGYDVRGPAGSRRLLIGRRLAISRGEPD